MKKLLDSVIVIGLIFLVSEVEVFAAHPSGYDKYGELADEIYYDELGLLAQIVWCEAGNQDLHGKELVADVILNRVDDPDFPDTIQDVIFEKGQFSTANDYWLGKAAKGITEDCYQAVANEIEDRNDTDILYFRTGGFSAYGEAMYKYGDHYFSK